MLAPWISTDPAEAQLALDRVLRSRVFSRAERSRRFLRYLVEAALAQPPVLVKEYTIAIDVFDRDAGYDPSIDATVRVEASRLRGRLREYYDDEGRAETLVIEVPKGSYAAVLHCRDVPGTEPATVHAHDREQENASGPLQRAATAAEGVRRSRGLWLLGAGSVLLLMAVLSGLVIPHRPEAHSAAASPTPSLAILPLVNRTGDPGLDTLCDGLTDDLIRQLSQLPALKLIARTSVFRYRQTTMDSREVGKELRVGAVMTSELRRTPEHLALAVELSNIGDGTVLLNREYIVETKDLRSVQAELGRDLIERLHVQSSALDPGRSLRSVTASPEVYREFLAGDSLARSGAPADLHHALVHFERAVALDPGFDLGWSALASAHVLLGLYFEAPRDHMPLARTFAKRALTINPSLGEAHGSLGVIELLYDWNPTAAKAEMTAAGAGEAAISTLSCTAHLIERAGEPRTAEEVLGRMLTYDPKSASLIGELGCVAYYRGDYPAALRHYRQALAADPQSPVPYWGLGKTLNAQRHYDDAVGILEMFKKRNGFEPPLLTAEKGYSLGASGKRQEARTVAQELAGRGRRSFVDPYLVALVYASMNDREATFGWLEKAFEARSPFMISLPSEPKWEPLRADPRFERLLGRMLRG